MYGPPPLLAADEENYVFDRGVITVRGVDVDGGNGQRQSVKFMERRLFHLDESVVRMSFSLSLVDSLPHQVGISMAMDDAKLGQISQGLKTRLPHPVLKGRSS